ncbi:MAG TPA: heme o synthase [Gemmatimonadaceae bacterium]
MVELALGRAAAADFVELSKPRIVTMVAITAGAGYLLAGPASQWMTLVHTLAGTALVAGGACALNQVAERDVDARMRRTASRPIPAGRLGVVEGAVFGALAGASGIAWLAASVNAVTAALAAATLVLYVFLYTPLKRRTSLAILVGAVPGALPIVGGWTAAGGALDTSAAALFWILFLWQLPHFLALGWIYRVDYARAGLRIGSEADDDGRRTFRQAALQAAALLAVSLAPTPLGLAGPAYFFGALLLSAGFLLAATEAARAPSAPSARRLFLVSLVYLPALLTLMLLDRRP